MDSFPIDDLVPVKDMHLVERDSDLIVQHGGVVTRITFDKVVRMPVSEYFKDSPVKYKDDFQIIRDYSHGNITMILKDQVAVYSVQAVEDVPLNKLTPLLSVETEQQVFPDIPYPIIGYIVRKDCKIITVYLEPRWFHYHAAEINPAVRVQHPPLWLRVQLSNSGSLLGCAIALVRTNSVKWEDTKLYHLALPNVFNSHEVCLGGSHIDGGTSSPTAGQVIMSLYHQIFDSNWNFHLFEQKTVDEITAEAFAAVRQPDTLFDGLTADSHSQLDSLKRLLTVLSIPEGWRLIKWRESRTTATSFVTKGGRQ